MDSPLAHILRRSRRATNAQHAPAPRAITSLVEYTPEQLSSLSAASSANAASLAKAQSAKATSSTQQRVAAQPATIATSLSPGRLSSFAQDTPSSTAASSTLSSVIASPSSSLSSSSRSSSSSSTSTSTTVLTVTSAPASSSATVSTTSFTPVSSIASNVDTSTSKLSTGGIAGVVIAAILGVLIFGSLLGWAYRRYKARGYAMTPWRKFSDSDSITPITHRQDKYRDHDLPPAPKQEKLIDVYDEPTPVMGSRRALALARNNAFNNDGSLRPDSTMIERNQAGLGAGMHSYGATIIQPQAAFAAPPRGYGPTPMQGAPYGPGADGRAPINYSYAPHMAHLTPVPMGRPAAPKSTADLETHEDFADMPDSDRPNATSHNSSDGYALPYDDPPRSAASTTSSWSAVLQSATASAVPQTRNVSAPTGSRALPAIPRSASAGFPSAATEKAALAKSNSSNALPTHQPLSPLSSSFDLRAPTSMAAALSSEPTNQQKRVYGDISRAVPKNANTSHSSHGSAIASSDLHGSTSSHEGDATFDTARTGETSFSTGHARVTTASPAPPYSYSPPSAPARLPPPPITLSAPQPYLHGRPLSPLEEVPTPLSSTPSSRNLAGDQVNPFDRLPTSSSSRSLTGRNLLPPHSASSGSSIPSLRYPPPTPGGMSVPGSVTDSPMVPRRWSGRTAGVRGSVLSDEDAYGGI